MPEAVEPAAALTGWLLTYLLHSTVMALGAVLLSRFAPVRAATLDVVWKVAVLAPLVTATTAVVAGTEPTLHALALVEREVDRRTELDPLTGVAGPGRLLQIRATLVDATPACRAVIRSARPADATWVRSIEEACGSGGWTWFSGLLALWLGGAVLALAMTGRRVAGLSALRRSCTVADERSRRILAELEPGSAGSGGTPRVVASPVVPSPCVLPGGSIVLPTRCEEEFSDVELRATLAHELAHVRRRDADWSLALRVLGALLWPQPLLRLAAARCREAAEHTCDHWALSATGERVGLARSIERVAGWSVGVPPVADVTMAGRRTHEARERVARILREEEAADPRWVRVLVPVLLVMPFWWLPSVPPPLARAAVFVEEIRADAPAGSIEEIRAGPPAGSIEADSLSRPVRIERVRLSWVGRGSEADGLHVEIPRPH